MPWIINQHAETSTTNQEQKEAFMLRFIGNINHWMNLTSKQWRSKEDTYPASAG